MVTGSCFVPALVATVLSLELDEPPKQPEAPAASAQSATAGTRVCRIRMLLSPPLLGSGGAGVPPLEDAVERVPLADRQGARQHRGVPQPRHDDARREGEEPRELLVDGVEQLVAVEPDAAAQHD